MTADAYHLSATHPEGIGAKEAMRQALQEAELTMEDVDYLNPHATSTPVGDISEIKAIMAMIGSGKNDTWLSGTKSMTGHLMGAAGAIEAIISIMAMRDNVIPPTINTTNIDPQIPSNINIATGESMEKRIEVAMSNTFGFGGHNGIAVFKKI